MDNMKLANILNIIKQSDELKVFLHHSKNVEIQFKNLNSEEIKRIFIEYPDLLKETINRKVRRTEELEKNAGNKRICCFTFVKTDLNQDNYKKLKKIKLYIDLLNDNIIKILQNY